MEFIKECIAWFIYVFRKSFTISGRARRREYWMFTLALFVITIALTIFDLVTGLTFETTNSRGEIEQNGILSTIFSFVILPASFTAYIRRLHDVGKSGWWALLPLVGVIPMLGGGAFLIIGAIIMVSAAIYLLFLIIRKGDIGPNQYGPDPLEGNY